MLPTVALQVPMAPLGPLAAPLSGPGYLVVLAVMCLLNNEGAAQIPDRMDCDPGDYFSTRFDRCRRCIQGTYKPTRGPGPCTYCQKDDTGRNASTTGDGAVSKDQCYFRPYMTSFYPQKGPLAGGTLVNITLRYLTNHSIVRVRFANVISTNCTRSVSSYLCYTRSSPKLTAGRVSIELMDPMSEYVAHSTSNYSYLPNPVITGVQNLSTFLSGGKLLTVTGENLDSVAAPRFVVTRIYMNDTRYFHNSCVHINSTVITCQTPDLKDGLDLPEQSATDDNFLSGEFVRRRRSPSNSSPLNSKDLQFYAGFELDGVSNFTTFAELPVFKDPIFHKFPEHRHLRYFYRSRDRVLGMKANGLENVVDISEVFVSVGSAPCVVTSLYSNALTCLPPLRVPSHGKHGQGPRGSHFVLVRVGYLTFHVGFLKYVNERQVARDLILGLSLCGVGLALIFGIWCIRVYFTWCFKRKLKVPSPEDPEAKMPSTPMVTSSRSASTSTNGSDSGMYTGNVSTNNSDDATNTDFAALGNEEQGTHMMHIDLWSALQEPLKSKVIEYQIEARRLTLGDCIGVGSFGRVFMGQMEAEDGCKKTVAVKTLRDGFTSPDELPQFLEEALIMAGFQHENILPLYGVVVSDCLPFVVSEYMDRGDLRTFIKNAPVEDTGPQRILGFAHQVAYGMEYLSSKGFVHRDLAARNCLINSHDVVKIGDFGLSRDLHGQDYYRVGEMGRPLPVKWMSIESLNLGKFSTKSDVWSFGVVMWELLTRGRTPYSNTTNIDLKDYINNESRLPKPDEASNVVYELMLSCWKADPAERPTFEELVIILNDMLEVTRVDRQISRDSGNDSDGLSHHSDPESDAGIEDTQQSDTVTDNHSQTCHNSDGTSGKAQQDDGELGDGSDSNGDSGSGPNDNTDPETSLNCKDDPENKENEPETSLSGEDHSAIRNSAPCDSSPESDTDSSQLHRNESDTGNNSNDDSHLGNDRHSDTDRGSSVTPSVNTDTQDTMSETEKVA